MNNIFNLGFNISKKINEYNSHNCYENNLINLYKELYKRFLVPFYIPILILISLFLITKNKENKNYKRYKLIIFISGFVTIIFSESTLKMIQNNLIENLSIFLLPVFVILFLYFYFFYIFKFKYMN